MSHQDIRLGTPERVGELCVDAATRGLVLFAHGSGSSHASARNRLVAWALHGRGLGTVLVDLLSPSETLTRQHVFDIPLLADRLTQALDWVQTQPALRSLPLGLFGASTGAAAALVLAARRSAEVVAVVSRGGRPDLAEAWLPQVRAPTLLIVGSEDQEVLALNRHALQALRCVKHLDVVPGATHLFEEPGALEQVARQAADWFDRHLVHAPQVDPFGKV